MLKERKLKSKNLFNDYYYGNCKIKGYDKDIYGVIKDENIIKEIEDEEFYFAEVKTSASDSDYHTYNHEYFFEGVFLNFNLNTINTIKYFGIDWSNEFFPKTELISYIEKLLEDYNMVEKRDEHDVGIVNDCLKITIPKKRLDKETLNFCSIVLQKIQNYYSNKGVHITRMFGSYILLAKVNGKLKAVHATNIPIEYCPLMYKLLKEVGGPSSENLIAALNTKNKEEQRIAMCELINEVVIKGGYFATNRPLNSCEANVLFGASETISSAFKSNMIDAAVIVSNNLGTIITTNDLGTQGAVQRMTGLFYTSPSKQLVNTALNENILPVFSYTAEIDQLEGVKKAISLGYKRIAVSVAAGENYLHKELAELEKDGITIYKFGLCSTGIDRKTAKIMQEYADVIWSCASKEVKEWIEPNALLQVGVKIPVHIMTKKGSEIVKNHLQMMYQQQNIDFSLTKGEEKNVILNEHGNMRILKKKDLHSCNDCPYPCL